jgi:hypothetical protein
MNSIALLQILKKDVRNFFRKTALHKDFQSVSVPLTDENANYKEPNVFLYALPKKTYSSNTPEPADELKSLLPAIIIAPDMFSETIRSELSTAVCSVVFTLINYSENEHNGKLEGHFMAEHLRINLLKQRVFANKFELINNVSYFCFPDDEYPYFETVLNAEFSCPAIPRTDFTEKRL